MHRQCIPIFFHKKKKGKGVLVFFFSPFACYLVSFKRVCDGCCLWANARRHGLEDLVLLVEEDNRSR